MQTLPFKVVPGVLEYERPQMCMIPLEIQEHILPMEVHEVCAWLIAPHTLYIHAVSDHDNSCGSTIIEIRDLGHKYRVETVKGPYVPYVDAWCHEHLSHVHLPFSL